MHNDGLFIPPATDRLSAEMERLSGQGAPLKKDGRAASPEEIKKTAQEFEALFINYLLKTMQDTVGESDLFGKGLGAESYRDMMYQELSRRLAQSGGIGLAKKVIESLHGNSETAGPNPGPLRSDPVAPLWRPNLSTPPPDPGPVPLPAGEPETDADEGFLRPVQGRQTSGYGVRAHPIGQHKHFHRGVDLAAPKGSPILAARSGRVVFSGYQKGYGNTVVIDHEDGYRTRYAHLQRIEVAAGDHIHKGHALGRVGQSGRATGPHLHFEISRNNVPVDPRDLLYNKS